MLDNNFKAVKNDKTDFEPLPKDIYLCRLAEITLEKRESEYSTEPQDFLSFQWDVLDTEFTRQLWSNFVKPTLRMNRKKGKSKLCRIVEAITGKELTTDIKELSGDFLNSLIGGTARVSVEIDDQGDKGAYNRTVDWLKVKSDQPVVGDVKNDQTPPSFLSPEPTATPKPI